MTRNIPAHMQTPLTVAEAKFLRALLRYGNARYNWPSSSPGPLGRSLSTPWHIEIITRIMNGTCQPEHQFGELADTLEAMRKVCAGCITDDLPPHEKRIFSSAEYDVMEEAYHLWNGDTETFTPGVWHWRACRWMGYYAAKLRYLGQVDEQLAA